MGAEVVQIAGKLVLQLSSDVAAQPTEAGDGVVGIPRWVAIWGRLARSRRRRIRSALGHSRGSVLVIRPLMCLRVVCWMLLLCWWLSVRRHMMRGGTRGDVGNGRRPIRRHWGDGRCAVRLDAWRRSRALQRRCLQRRRGGWLLGSAIWRDGWLCRSVLVRVLNVLAMRWRCASRLLGIRSGWRVRRHGLLGRAGSWLRRRIRAGRGLLAGWAVAGIGHPRAARRLRARRGLRAWPHRGFVVDVRRTRDG